MRVATSHLLNNRGQRSGRSAGEPLAAGVRCGQGQRRVRECRRVTGRIGAWGLLLWLVGLAEVFSVNTCLAQRPLVPVRFRPAARPQVLPQQESEPPAGRLDVRNVKPLFGPGANEVDESQLRNQPRIQPEEIPPPPSQQAGGTGAAAGNLGGNLGGQDRQQQIPGGVPRQVLPGAVEPRVPDWLKQEEQRLQGGGRGGPEEIGPPAGGNPNGEVIRQRYPNGKVQILRHVRQDDEGNYVNHGPWKLFNQQGQVLAEGQFADGFLQGSWQRWHGQEDQGLLSESPFKSYGGPFLSVAYFKSGKLHGSWVIFDASRRKIFEMGYDEGKRDGVAIWWYPNGMKMRQMAFQQGLLHGEFVEWNTQGQVARRERFVQGRQLITRKTEWKPDQEKTEEHFIGSTLEVAGDDDWWNALPAGYEPVGEELQHGPSLAWHANGQPLRRGEFQLGRRQGEFAFWHDNGQKAMAGSYADDLKTGTWRYWHPNGMKLAEGGYAEGQPEGVWRFWSEQGQLNQQVDVDQTPTHIDALLPSFIATLDPSEPASDAEKSLLEGIDD